MEKTMQFTPVLLVAVAVCLSPEFATGASETAGIEREIIPGSELMSAPERERYRQRMRAAASAEERNKVREEHVKQMRERARVRGLRLAEPVKQGTP
jgi:hypothetical protein